MPIITTENINTLAQLAASIMDGDYIYIYKSASNSFARIEKSVFLSGVTGGATSSKVKANVNALQEKIDELLSALAPLAYNGSIPSTVGALDWDEATPDPTPAQPVLTSPTSAQVNVGTNTGSGVSKQIYIKGSNLTQALGISINGTGFSFSVSSVSAASANAGTYITVSYNGTASTANAVLIISSSEVSVSVPLTASYSEQPVQTTHNVTFATSGLSNCSVSNSPSSSVVDGGDVTIVIAPSSGYTLSGVTANVSATNGTETHSYNQSTDRITVVVSNITADTTITIAATATQQQVELDYVQKDKLLLHLDCKNRGGVSGHWKSLVGDHDFVLTDCVESDNGVEFNGTSSMGVCSPSINQHYTAQTIEVVFKDWYPVDKSSVFRNNRPTDANPNAGITISYWNRNNSQYRYIYAIGGGCNFCLIDSDYNGTPMSGVISLTAPNSGSSDGSHAVKNGVVHSPLDSANSSYFSIHSDIRDKMTLGYSKISDGTVTFMQGKILAVRIYNCNLTVEEMQTNQSVDAMKYGLTLNTGN